MDNIKAVIFDLDDTVFGETEYVKSGCRAIADFLNKEYGFDGREILKRLVDESPFGIIDKFCEETANIFDKEKLIDVYRNHTPDIKPYPDVIPTLEKLKSSGIKLALLTDGRPSGQRKKIAALGIEKYFDTVIVSDELGGKEYRKPNFYAYEKICKDLDVEIGSCMVIGDNPKKDFLVGEKGAFTVRISRGTEIYADSEYLNGVKEKMTVNTLTDIFEEETNGEEYKSFIRQKLLEITDFVHEVCVKEGIDYSLFSGSLIGAIRHKGFIPWDDDMDICMSREDFKRFSAAIEGYCKDSKFRFVTTRRRVPVITFKDKVIRGGKAISGLRADIFILDNIPDSPLKRKLLIFRMKILQGMMHKGKIDWSRYDFKGKILVFGTKMLGVFRTYAGLIKSYNRLSVKYNKKPSACYFASNDVYSAFSLAYPKEWFDGTIDCVFEDRVYRMYKGYDPILRLQYGDYMIPPPVSERNFAHTEAVEEDI